MDPKSLIGDLTPEQQASWTKQYATKPEQWAAENRVPEMNQPPPGPTPEQLAPFNAPMGAPKPAPKPLFDAVRHESHGADPVALAASQKSNLEGATFYDSPTSAAGSPPRDFVRPQASGAGGMVPGAWQHQSAETTTKKGYDTPESVKEGYVQAKSSELAAADAGRDAGIAKANAESAYLDRHVQNQAEHQQEMARRQDEHAAQFDKEYGKLQSLRDDVSKGKIDPNQYMASKDGYAQFAIGLSVMLGAVSQSLGGGENPGLKMVNDSIARNIDAQKANLAQDHGRLDAQRSLMGDLRAHFGDTDKADQAAWILYLDKAKNELAGEMAKATIPDVKAKYASAIALLDEKSATHQERWAKDANDSIVTEQHERYTPAHMAGGGVDEKAIITEANKRFNDPNFMPGAYGASREQAAYRSARLSFTGQDVMPGAGQSNVSSGAKKRTEQESDQIGADEFNKQMDTIVKSPEFGKLGLGAAIASHLPQRIAPDSNLLQTDIDAINTQVLQAVGKVAKEADGKPNKVMIEKIESHFGVNLGDTRAQAERKIEGARRAVNALARQQGVSAPEPGEQSSFKKAGQ